MIVQPYKVVLTKDEDVRCFTATIKEFHGCTAYGRTREGAVRNLRKVVLVWLEAAVSFKRNIPPPEQEYYLSIGVHPSGKATVILPLELRIGGSR
jgi:predicted RNase H-like HicB family nuclease